MIGLMNACGPSEEEQRRQAQARQDSLERVRQQRMEQRRLDSLAQVRQDSIAAAQQAEKERSQIQFDKNGPFAVQVEAWRSEDKAQGQIEKWKGRGFDNAYVVKSGDENTGEVWFRVRLGRFATLDMAHQFQNQLQEDYQAQSWVSSTNQEMMNQPSSSSSDSTTDQ